MLRYFGELYRDKSFTFRLFWDGGPRALGLERFSGGSPRSIEVLPLEDPDGVAAALSSIGHAGEAVEIVLFGPACLELLREMDGPQAEAAEWILGHKAAVIPAGLAEEDMTWDYETISHSDGKFIALAISTKAQIGLARAFLRERGLRSGGARPLLGLGLDRFGLDTLIGLAPGFPLEVPGTKTELVRAAEGYTLATSPIGSALEGTRDFAAGAKPSPGLAFEGPEDDFLSKAHAFSVRYFRKIFLALLCVAALALASNALLAVEEASLGERLAEKRFLEAQLGGLQEQVEALRAEESAFEALEGKRTRIAGFLGGLAHAKPEMVWWRKLDYAGQGSLTLEGFSVGEGPATEYFGKLSSLAYLGGAELVSVTKFDPPPDSPIPGKFHGELFKFKLAVRGVR